MKIIELIRLFLTLGVIVGPLPNNIANGQTIDAVPVMADFNWLKNQVNANAAPLVGTPTLAQLAASNGSSLIGYLPGGTGAVATTVQDKLRYAINVRDFGATGDGTTDDTAACQLMHNYLAAASNPINNSGQPWNGSDVAGYYPQGQYAIAAEVLIAGSQVILGTRGSTYSQSTIKQTVDGINCFRLTAASDGITNSTVIEGMTFKSGSATVNLAVAQIKFTAGLTGTNSVYIRNNSFVTPEAWAIDAQQGDDLQITGNLFDKSAENAIRLGQTAIVTNFRIAGNDFYQIALESIRALNVQGGIITGNTVEACGGVGAGTHAFFSSVGLTAVDTVNITNNTVRNFTGNVIILGTPSVAMNVQGNNVLQAVTGSRFVLLSGGSTLNGSSISDNTVNVPTGAVAQITDSGTSVFFGCPIQGNTFVSTGGNSATAISITSAGSLSNSIKDNVYINWTAPESINLASQNNANNTVLSNVISPGVIAGGAEVTAAIGGVSGASTSVPQFIDWIFASGNPLPVGGFAYAIITGANTVTMHYVNPTAGNLTFAAHQVYVGTRKALLT